MIKHIIKSQQFEPQDIKKLFTRTAQIQQSFSNPAGRVMLNRNLKDKILFNIFYEPSTRTRLSFAAAAHHLGMQVSDTENATQFSSVTKGETLEDTIKVLCLYHPDVIVLRHHEDGAAERAAEISPVPIINAGDGRGQHPTQALLDLYTIWRRLKTLNGLTILVGGDLAHGRTVRSLVYLFSKFKGNQFIFCSPEQLKMLPDIKQHLNQKEIPYTEVYSALEEVINQADVVYWTRVQAERIEDPDLNPDALRQRFTIDKNLMAYMKPYSVLMHPLPRVSEISTECDSDIRSVYFEQAGNGMFVRMGLLEYILKKDGIG